MGHPTIFICVGGPWAGTCLNRALFRVVTLSLRQHWHPLTSGAALEIWIQPSPKQLTEFLHEGSDFMGITLVGDLCRDLVPIPCWGDLFSRKHFWLRRHFGLRRHGGYQQITNFYARQNNQV